MLQRALTGTVFVATIVAATIWHPLAFGLLFLLVTLGSTWEFFRLNHQQGIAVPRLAATVAAGLIYLINLALVLGYSDNFTLLLLAVPILFGLAIIELFRKTEQPFTNIAFAWMAVIYITLPFAALNHFPALQQAGGEPWALLLGFFFMLWANDTGAYLSGSQFGRHKLFERVSPNKSWEGSIGGMLLAFATAYGLYRFFPSLPLTDWLTLAAIIVVSGSLGDLLESRYKRSIPVKDSGSFLPGHGGWLDRFDAVLLAAPLVLTYLVFR